MSDEVGKWRGQFACQLPGYLQWSSVRPWLQSLDTAGEHHWILDNVTVLRKHNCQTELDLWMIPMHNINPVCPMPWQCQSQSTFLTHYRLSTGIRLVYIRMWRTSKAGILCKLWRHSIIQLWQIKRDLIPFSLMNYNWRSVISSDALALSGFLTLLSTLAEKCQRCGSEEQVRHKLSSCRRALCVSLCTSK